MAVLTVDPIWNPKGYSEITATSGKPIYLFGVRVPDNVFTCSHWYSVDDGGTWIGWTTRAGNNHKHLLRSEGSPDDITAILVLMRMSE